MSSILGHAIVGFVLCLISFIAYSSQIFIIWPWYGEVLTVPLLTLLLPFNFLVGMLFWNYLLVVISDPGGVPDSWKPDTHSDGYEVKKLTGRPRYCRSCEKYKPPRAHHCRQCNRCIIRMDHHCPWANNCVGHFNYGHFVRFLFYVDVACSYHLFMITRRTFDLSGRSTWDDLSAVELVTLLMNYMTCVPVLLSVGAFSIYHFYGLLGNSTTIEGWEKDKVATLFRKGKIHDVKFPYNLGWRKNIESVMGSNPWLWCWPTVPPGSGLKYELVTGRDKEIEFAESWPPRDPLVTEHEGFSLPDSPWTYENNSFNPELRPTNSQIRRKSSNSRQRRKRIPGTSSLPPYHPDYQEGDTTVSSDDEEYYANPGRPLVRRGSEGYEIRPIGREDMLEHYLYNIGDDPDRYNKYIPEPESSDEEDDENVPLGTRVRS